jgi:hypothetical protein
MLLNFDFHPMPVKLGPLGEGEHKCAKPSKSSGSKIPKEGYGSNETPKRQSSKLKEVHKKLNCFKSQLTLFCTIHILSVFNDFER